MVESPHEIVQCSDKSNFKHSGFATTAIFAADAVVVTVQIISVGAKGF